MKRRLTLCYTFRHECGCVARTEIGLHGIDRNPVYGVCVEHLREMYIIKRSDGADPGDF